MEKIKSYNTQIWVGLKEGYDGPTHIIDEIYNICNKYVNDAKYCVTVTPTKYFYVNGFEDGAIIGLINYPRFPNTKKGIIKKALELGNILMTELNQCRISITTPDNTYLLENKTKKK